MYKNKYVGQVQLKTKYTINILRNISHAKSIHISVTSVVVTGGGSGTVKFANIEQSNADMINNKLIDHIKLNKIEYHFTQNIEI